MPNVLRQNALPPAQFLRIPSSIKIIPLLKSRPSTLKIGEQHIINTVRALMFA
jgi:hypothetical protein